MQASKTSKSGEVVDASTTVCCFRLGAIIVAGLIFASLIDIADFAVTLAAFFSVGGILRGTAAAIGNDELLARSLNRWDEAAILIALSFMVYWAGV